MKTQKILDNYCRLYGATMPEINRAQTHYFVTISADGVGVLYLHKASKLLGQIVGRAMKNGTVLYVHDGWVKPLTWETWKQTWEKLFAPKPRKNNAPEPNTTKPYKSEIFETMKQKRNPKKPQNHGFERGFIANQSMNLLTPATLNMGVEYL